MQNIKQKSHTPLKLALPIKIMGGDILTYSPVLSTPNKTFMAVLTIFFNLRSILECLLMVQVFPCGNALALQTMPNGTTFWACRTFHFENPC